MEVNGLHDRCQLVIAVGPPPQHIECKVDLCVCSNKATIARELCLLCVTHACILHRNAELVKLKPLFCAFYLINSPNDSFSVVLLLPVVYYGYPYECFVTFSVPQFSSIFSRCQWILPSHIFIRCFIQRSSSKTLTRFVLAVREVSSMLYT